MVAGEFIGLGKNERYHNAPQKREGELCLGSGGMPGVQLKGIAMRDARLGKSR